MIFALPCVHKQKKGLFFDCWFLLQLGNVIQCERRSEPLASLDGRSSESSPGCWGLILPLVWSRRCYCSDPLTGCWILSLDSETGRLRMVPLPLALSQCPMSTQAAVIPIAVHFCCRGSVCGSSPAQAENNAETFRVSGKASRGFPEGSCLAPEVKLCVLCY